MERLGWRDEGRDGGTKDKKEKEHKRFGGGLKLFSHDAFRRAGGSKRPSQELFESPSS